MAQKDRSQWTEAYRKRVERAEAKAARQGVVFKKSEARGHRAQEHITRRQNKLAREQGIITLTPQQRGQITKFWKELQPQYRTKAHLDKINERIEAQGFEWFQNVRKAKRELERGAHKRPRGSGALTAALLNVGIPPEDDMDWLLYYNG